MEYKDIEKHINEIADNLEYEMKCFVNLDNFAVEFASDGMQEFEEENLQHYNWQNFVVLEPFTTHEKFHIMDLFAESIKNKRFKDKLFFALDNENPLANFRRVIKKTEFEADWKKFNLEEKIKLIKEKIENLNQ